MRIDLNCDMGESFGSYKIGNDEEILQHITSANIACGFHGGDPNVINHTVMLALQNKVAIGAHIGYQDLMGFGRRSMELSLEEIHNLTIYQIGALYGFVKAHGGRMHHVKPHGALYNASAQNRDIARSIAEAIYKVDPTLILYGLSGSALITEGKKAGLRTASEVFADRSYTEQGTLTPRKEGNAIIQEEEKALNQVIMMVKEGKAVSTTGKAIMLQADTLCIHGDAPRALEFAKKIKKRLVQEGIILQSIY